MKNNYLFVNLAIVLAIGIVFIIPTNDKEGRRYNSRGNNHKQSAVGAVDYMSSLRVNQKTKTIDINDFKEAQKQLAKKAGLKSTGTTWDFRGPNNKGGRTRAILIDKDNSSVMFAGSVSGGLWKTTTAGLEWEQVDYAGASTEDFENLAVTSICQTSNGDIYFGTGEGFFYPHGTNLATPMIMGSGIWKSSDNGATFEKLTSTISEENQATFAIINKLAADPSNANLIYAATWGGLKVSQNGGDSWSDVTLSDAQYANSVSSDVKVGENGTVVANIANKCFVKQAGGSVFELKSGSIDDNLINDANIGRLEFAFAPSNPDYIYCLASDNVDIGYLENVYKSTDNGNTWVVVGRGGSSNFQPLGSQGIYDMAIAVNPTNEEQIFIGGLDMFVGNKVAVGDLFEWNQISINTWPENSPLQLYVHADQHTIVFDPKNPKVMFIGSDGGVAKGVINEDGYTFVSMNTNYSVTQFYSVAANAYGMTMGGTQDNGTILVPYQDLANGYELLGGDGGQAAMSKYNTSIAFATAQFGFLIRNNDETYSMWNTFYDPDLENGYDIGSDGAASFVTPIALWESHTDPHQLFDSVEFLVRQTTDESGDTVYKKGKFLYFDSDNIFRAKIGHTLTKTYEKGDTIKIRDKYSSLFALGMAKSPWVTRIGTDWSKTPERKDWWRVVNTGVLSSSEYVTHLEFSTDGNNLFFATSDQELYRLSNLRNAKTWKDATYLFNNGSNVITELTKIGKTEGQVITDIACDPNDPDNIIITMGNYGNENYVYFCGNATSAGESQTLENFKNVTGDLPKMPVYSALFENVTQFENESKKVFLGTDMGVFMSEAFFEQVTPTNLEWIPDQQGVGPVPVMGLCQNTSPDGYNFGSNGSIYLGTHGRGIFETKDYLSVDEDPLVNNTSAERGLQLDVYPNPVVDYALVKVELPQNGELSTEIINLKGQVILTQNHGFGYQGENELHLSNLENLESGAYIVKVSVGKLSGSQRFIKK